MSFAALVSLKQTLEQILLQPYQYSRPFEKQRIEDFHSKLEYLLDFLENTPLEIDERTNSFEIKITDSAYRAHDFFDLHQTNLLGPVNITQFKIHAINSLRTYIAAINDIPELVCQHEFALSRISQLEKDDFQNMEEEFDSILEDAGKIKELPGLLMVEESDFRASNSSSSGSSKLGSSSKNPIVGFEEQLVQIKDRLTGEPDKLNILLSLVGMGGIGKTTLATNVYKDPCVACHFDIRIWVTVSQSYSTREIMLHVLDSMDKLTDKIRGETEDRLVVCIHKALKDKRYLVIIDDIWDTRAWDLLKFSFPNDNNGSRIILTTRLRDVATYAESSETYEIPLLSTEQCWTLLCAKVFRGESCPSELQEMGMKIAQNCGGLPLSVVVIGGLLSQVKMTQDEWRKVAANVSSLVSSSGDQCSETLRLSYKYLPHRLKACFLYMGVFPEDYEIPASKLANLWAAEGFLKQDRLKCLEEVAERCLEELVERSLILPYKRNYDGKIKTCKIHDLLRHFCVKEANKENFLYVAKSYANVLPYISHSQRRTIIHPTTLKGRADFLYSTPSLSYARLFIILGKHDLSSPLFLKFRLLRTLDASRVSFLEFPLEILELSNLRYIAFKYKGNIPGSISKLLNLQTLIIHQDYRLFERKVESYLPVEIWDMLHLRHVHFLQISYLDPADAPLILKDLRTLSGIRNLKFTVDMLNRISNIRKLEITYDPLSWEKGFLYYHLENLVHLDQLTTLTINLWVIFGSNMTSGLKYSFPPSLEKLSLRGCEIPWHNLSIIGSLPNLQVLKLREHACQGPKWEAA
ncbi:putative late blight resistance protein homolog R1A-10 [Primulina tabacum]|uniref:putative late blight resistance protein homolog R1A-10 n=1 Tax=Primulina tabacum TaxID=48773 RepID=UPI003F5A765C